MLKVMSSDSNNKSKPETSSPKTPSKKTNNSKRRTAPQSPSRVQHISLYRNHHDMIIERSEDEGVEGDGQTPPPGPPTGTRRKTPSGDSTKSRDRDSTYSSGSSAGSSRRSTPQRQLSASPSQSPARFQSYMSLDAVQRGLKKGELIEGVLRINPKNYEDSYITAPGGEMDICLMGVHDRNRALQGDVVAVRVNPVDRWRVLKDVLLDFLIAKATMEDFQIFYGNFEVAQAMFEQLKSFQGNFTAVIPRVKEAKTPNSKPSTTTPTPKPRRTSSSLATIPEGKEKKVARRGKRGGKKNQYQEKKQSDKDDEREKELRTSAKLLEQTDSRTARSSRTEEERQVESVSRKMKEGQKWTEKSEKKGNQRTDQQYQASSRKKLFNKKGKEEGCLSSQKKAKKKDEKKPRWRNKKKEQPGLTGESATKASGRLSSGGSSSSSCSESDSSENEDLDLEPCGKTAISESHLTTGQMPKLEEKHRDSGDSSSNLCEVNSAKLDSKFCVKEQICKNVVDNESVEDVLEVDSAVLVADQSCIGSTETEGGKATEDICQADSEVSVADQSCIGSTETEGGKATEDVCQAVSEVLVADQSHLSSRKTRDGKAAEDFCQADSEVSVRDQSRIDPKETEFGKSAEGVRQVESTSSLADQSHIGSKETEFGKSAGDASHVKLRSPKFGETSFSLTVSESGSGLADKSGVVIDPFPEVPGHEDVPHEKVNKDMADDVESALRLGCQSIGSESRQSLDSSKAEPEALGTTQSSGTEMGHEDPQETGTEESTKDQSQVPILEDALVSDQAQVSEAPPQTTDDGSILQSLESVCQADPIEYTTHKKSSKEEAKSKVKIVAPHELLECDEYDDFGIGDASDLESQKSEDPNLEALQEDLDFLESEFGIPKPEAFKSDSDTNEDPTDDVSSLKKIGSVEDPQTDSEGHIDDAPDTREINSAEEPHSETENTASETGSSEEEEEEDDSEEESETDSEETPTNDDDEVEISPEVHLPRSSEFSEATNVCTNPAFVDVNSIYSAKDSPTFPCQEKNDAKDDCDLKPNDVHQHGCLSRHESGMDADAEKHVQSETMNACEKQSDKKKLNCAKKTRKSSEDATGTMGEGRKRRRRKSRTSKEKGSDEKPEGESSSKRRDERFSGDKKKRKPKESEGNSDSSRFVSSNEFSRDRSEKKGKGKKNQTGAREFEYEGTKVSKPRKMKKDKIKAGEGSFQRSGSGKFASKHKIDQFTPKGGNAQFTQRKASSDKKSSENKSSVNQGTHGYRFVDDESSAKRKSDKKKKDDRNNSAKFERTKNPCGQGRNDPSSANRKPRRDSGDSSDSQTPCSSKKKRDYRHYGKPKPKEVDVTAVTEVFAKFFQSMKEREDILQECITGKKKSNELETSRCNADDLTKEMQRDTSDIKTSEVLEISFTTPDLKKRPEVKPKEPGTGKEVEDAILGEGDKDCSSEGEEHLEGGDLLGEEDGIKLQMKVPDVSQTSGETSTPLMPRSVDRSSQGTATEGQPKETPDGTKASRSGSEKTPSKKEEEETPQKVDKQKKKKTPRKGRGGYYAGSLGGYLEIPLFLTPQQISQHPESAKFLQRTGQVVYIVEKKHSRVAVGKLKTLVDKDDGYALFTPTDSCVPKMNIPMAQCPNNFKEDPKTCENTLFLAKIISWSIIPIAEGELVTCLGDSKDVDVATHGILLEYNFDVENIDTLEYVNELHQMPFIISEEEAQKRKDFRNHCVFTIDPSTARDLDDAVSCEETAPNEYRVGVHIADVSYFLKEGQLADKKAKLRATSVYMVNMVLPMLPRHLCQNLCSLNPGEDKLSFSVEWTIGINGRILESPRIGRSMINSCCQLSYDHAQLMIENELEDLTEDQFPHIYGGFTLEDLHKRTRVLNAMTKALSAKREAGGRLRLDQPKLAFHLDETMSKANSFYPYEIKDSNKLIEELMLLANTAVAEFLYEMYPNLAVLRGHPHPRQKLLGDTLDVLEKYGIFLEGNSSKNLNYSLSQYFSKDFYARGRFQALVNMLAKPMVPARYMCAGSCDEISDFHHYALSLPLYTHFTSPIRRYPDVMVHRLLCSALEYQEQPDFNSTFVHKLMNHCNDRKLAARWAQEKSTDLFLSKFLQESPFEAWAIVVSVTSNSFDVLFWEMGNVVKRVYISKLPVLGAVFQRERGNNRLTLQWESEDGSKEETCQQMIGLLVIIRAQLVVSDTGMVIAKAIPPYKWPPMPSAS